MRRLSPWGLLLAVGLSVALSSIGSAGASAPAASVSVAQTAFWQGVKALLPANAGARPDVSVVSVSCASAGNCSAVGRYRNMSGNFQGLLLSETSGTWQRGVQAILPANAGSKPFAWFDSVSCSSPGNCAAVGFYNNSGNSHGLLVTETSGTWQPGVEAVLPANGSHTGDVTINSVSCASAGNCTAVGSYFDNATNGHGMLLTESSGTWQQGIEPPLPANADALALTSVSCVSAGNCTVVGAYDDSSHHIQGLLLTESSGTWQTGIEAVLPANASASAAFPQLQSVSCVSVGNCTAVGYYFNSAGRQGLLLTETSGTWQPGIEAILPANARSNPWVGLPSVSCVSAGNCTAVGGYDDSSHHHQGLLLRQTSGTWQTGVAAPLPVNAGSNPNVHLDSLSCVSAGNCAAVGGYHDSSNTDRKSVV